MKPKKLTLDRETLAPLSPAELHAVNGGDIGPATRFLCPPETRMLTVGKCAYDTQHYPCLPGGK